MSRGSFVRSLSMKSTYSKLARGGARRCRSEAQRRSRDSRVGHNVEHWMRGPHERVERLARTVARSVVDDDQRGPIRRRSQAPGRLADAALRPAALVEHRNDDRETRGPLAPGSSFLDGPDVPVARVITNVVALALVESRGREEHQASVVGQRHEAVGVARRE